MRFPPATWASSAGSWWLRQQLSCTTGIWPQVCSCLSTRSVVVVMLEVKSGAVVWLSAGGFLSPCSQECPSLHPGHVSMAQWVKWCTTGAALLQLQGANREVVGTHQNMCFQSWDINKIICNRVGLWFYFSSFCSQCFSEGWAFICASDHSSPSFSHDDSFFPCLFLPSVVFPHCWLPAPLMDFALSLDFSCLCPNPGLLWSPSSPVHTLPSPHHPCPHPVKPQQWCSSPAFPLSSLHLFFFFPPFSSTFSSGLCRIASLPRLPLQAELRGYVPISTPSKLWGFSGSPHCMHSRRPGDWYCTE